MKLFKGSPKAVKLVIQRVAAVASGGSSRFGFAMEVAGHDTGCIKPMLGGRTGAEPG